MFKKTTKIYLAVIILAMFFGLASFVFAQDAKADLKTEQTSILNTIGEAANYVTVVNPETELADRVGMVISVILGFLGVVFLALVVYSGYQWMTAGGDDEKIKKAKDRIIQASIGLAIIALSYAITSTVVGVLNNKKVTNLIENNSDIDNNFCWVTDSNKGGVCRQVCLTGEFDYQSDNCQNNTKCCVNN